MSNDSKFFLFCIILDLAILATISFFYYQSKCIWLIFFLLTLQKPSK